jgi:Domain of unknown function (DUF4349)/Putative zinc-finger
MNKIMHPIEAEELMAYIDGELTADRAAAAAAHLGECAECQGLVAGLRSVSQDLKAWKVEVAESALPATIERALGGIQPRNVLPARRSWREFLSVRSDMIALMGGVAAVLLVVFGTVRFQGRNTNQVFSQVASSSQVPPSISADDSSLANGHLVTMAPTAPPPPPPGSSLANDKQVDRLQQYAKLQSVPPTKFKKWQEDQSGEAHGPVTNGPMIVRTAELSVITKEFDKSRASLEAILNRHRGYLGQLQAGGNTGSGRTLTATLRVPADQLDAALNEVKTLGRVVSESQSGEDVTSQYVDLQARLANARNTEARLIDLLRNRTGRLSDVLDAERELDRVRGEIEQMEAERKSMASQVSYATLNATISEDYQAQLQVVPPSTSTRLGNAAVEGYRSMVDGVVSLILFLLSSWPSLLLWGTILFFPARMVWKRLRRSFAE